jgi:transcriptional regulator with XRE-family HTH domain
MAKVPFPPGRRGRGKLPKEGEMPKKLSRHRGAAGTRSTELTESILLRFRQNVDDRMRKLGMLRRDLADELGVSEGRVSQVLSSAENVTLRTVAAFLAAMDADIEFRIVGTGERDEVSSVWPEDLEDFQAQVQRMGEIKRPEPGRIPARWLVAAST